MKKAISYIVFGTALLIAACKKDPVVVAVTGSTKDLRIPANFEFKTTADIGLNVFVKSSTTVLRGTSKCLP